MLEANSKAQTHRLHCPESVQIKPADLKAIKKTAARYIRSESGGSLELVASGRAYLPKNRNRSSYNFQVICSRAVLPALLVIIATTVRFSILAIGWMDSRLDLEVV